MKIYKFIILFLSTVGLSVNTLMPTTIQMSEINTKNIQSISENFICERETKSLFSGYSSDYFLTGNLFLTGDSFTCPWDMHDTAEIVVGDFNHDERNDVAYTSGLWGFGYNLYIFLQDTQGKVSAQPIAYTLGARTQYLATGDLNHDNMDDIVAGDDSEGKIYFFLQQTDGGFLKETYPGWPDDLAVGDINNDNRDDISFPIWSSDQIGVYTQNSTGSLNPLVYYPSIAAGYDEISIGDVNNDGRNDVIKMNGQGTFSDILVYLQKPDGSLNNYHAYSLGSIDTYRARSVAVGEVTGDGLTDVIVSWGGSFPDTRISVFRQNESGDLDSPISYETWDAPYSLDLLDINNDGRLDVLVAHRGWQNVGVLIQNQDGTLAQEVLYPTNYSNTFDLAYSDLNNDSLVDIVATDWNGFDILFKRPTFSDVSANYWALKYIEMLATSGITSGCGNGNYCPANPVTRAQMAVFLEKGLHGNAFTPTDVSPTFNDTTGHWAEDWIEALKSDAITSGCGNGNYCPEDSVTRAQMAVFLLKAMHGSSYSPPVASPTFGDDAGHWAQNWIEELALEGITSGCGNGNYCPDSPVTRDQMAVFLVKAFGLP